MNFERIANLLVSGLNDAQVATIVGLSPGRISQLKAEKEFQLILQAKEVEARAGNVEEVVISSKYLAAEHKIIDHITANLHTAEFSEAVAALRVIADRHDRRIKINPIHESKPLLPNNVVPLLMPAFIVQSPPIPTFNSDREIIAVGGKSIAPLPSTRITELFKTKEAGQLIEGQVLSSERKVHEKADSDTTTTLSEEAKKVIESGASKVLGFLNKLKV